MHKPNNLLELDVKDSLDWDPVVEDLRIVVKADDGHVTLTGTVPSYDDKLRATEDVWTVGGVKAVDNELLVGLVGDVVTDAQMAAACASALDKDRFVPQGSVTATVVEGVVTLRGQVRHHYQRQAAEHAVSHVAGVVRVDNLVRISSDPIPTDVADRINKAYQRSAIIDDSRITVTSNGNTIYLDGTVGSYAAMSEAVDTAWAAPGVNDVVNRFVIEP
jgi:osmotically-inducible protein OsmY